MNCDNCGHENPEGARFCAGCGGPLGSSTKDANYPLLGQVVGGRYHIVELIGEGGMGVVYKAEQRLGSTIRKVAVKTLHAELSRDPSITARFHREVGTVAQLEHPNTVRVYDFGSTEDGTLYIAMEFLDGRALNKVIEKEGALEPRRTGHLLRQITGSLDEAHRQGIVHRDLKPENVLLIERAGEKDVVKLVDFGIAARTESGDREKEQKLTQQGMVLGTPPYMSPEQFTGKALDARSDIYSLGVMAYEMLTGQLPFQADTPWQWATHHMTSQPRPFDEAPSGNRIPEPLRRAVLKALSKEPHERQNSAGQFYAEFNAALGGLTSVAPAVNPRAKTEAMAEAPAMAVAATVAMATPAGSPAAAIPPGVALPPAPPRETQRQGRGLIYGLSGVAAVTLIGLVVALTSNGGSRGPAQPLDLTPVAENTPASSTVTENPPENPTLEPEPVEAPPVEPDKPASPPKTTKPSQTTKPASSTTTPSTPGKTSTPTPPATTATPTPTPTPPAQPPAQPTVTPPVAPPSTPPPAPPAASNACQQCIDAVSDGRFQAAATYYTSCSGAAKANCANRAGAKARNDAKALARNGKCAEAKQVVDAAVAMGNPRQKLQSALAGCP